MSIVCITMGQKRIARGKRYMSALATYIREEMERQDINQLELARRSDIPNSTLGRHLNDEVEEWKPSIILKISEGLGISFWRLMVVGGFPVDVPGSRQTQDRRLTELVAAFPWMLPMMEDMADLDPGDREAVMALLETIHRRREARSKQ
jgi:transcriptional regulator with XRE-family HTH domain